MTATLIVARLTFREAVRRRILLAALFFGLLFLAVYALGFNLIRVEVQREADGPSIIAHSEFFGFILMAGLYVINFLTVMMTVLTSVDTLSGEITTGTIHTLASKPVHRREILLGKWLGYAGMLTLYLLMMAGGVLAIVYLSAGYMPGGALRGLGLMWLNVMLLLSLSLLGGAVLSTLANGVLVFGMYGVAFVGGWIEQVGSFIENEAAISVGTVASLLLPSEALWKRAAYEMRSPIMGAVAFGNPFVGLSVPSTLMIVYAVGYMLVVLALAIRQFNSRDL
ncbi:MAG TPA: ABC transporter permease [Ardenticatenaceae bacterium]|nr:ABC transporter permease [Ardenticatenaceae bacterium]